MKIAIFGGAFNPVHNEHINLVKSAIKKFALDKVIIMPTFVSPHKTGKMFAEASHRLKMCNLAFKDIPQAEVSNYEIEKGGVSYSYLTCEHYARLYPNDELYFIIGADMLEYFPKWKNPERILDCVSLIACARENENAFESAVKNFKNQFQKPVLLSGYVGAKVSSTEIRTLASLGEDISAFVPENVALYIKTYGIYLQKNLVKVKNFLTEKRWQHTVNVSVMAVENCQKAEVDELTALTAAALHDCAKYPEKCGEILQNFVAPEGVPAPVIHQFAGAYMAGNYFKIENKDVILAIKYHTSGREDMTLLEKLIFLCDMLEKSRDFPHVNELRQYFYKDINLAFERALYHQIEYLKTTGKPVYNLTQKAYDYLKENK